jgi:hypothetical protein
MRLSLDGILVKLLLVAYAAATFVYGMHALATNPQYDNQVMFYADELRAGFRHHEMGKFLATPRKYPLLYVAPFAAAIETVERFHHGKMLENAAYYGTGRALSIFYAAATLWVLWLLGRRLNGEGMSALILLLTSVLFLLFTSAIRPHIPVTLFTLLAFWYALKLRDDPTRWNTAATFGSAMIAFCTLQSGLVAFVFPAWAYLCVHSGRIGIWKAAGISALCAALCFPIGYPFALAGLFGADVSTGIDLGHDIGLHFSLLHPFTIAALLLGSGPFILVFAALTMVRVLRGKAALPPGYLPALGVIILFAVLFAFHPISSSRFFLPIVPLLALLGARSFARAPRWAWRSIVLVTILGCLRLSWLALQPNTYQLAGDFAVTKQGLINVLNQPAYFFPIPEKRIVRDAAMLSDLHTIIIPDYVAGHVPDGLEQCAHMKSSQLTDEIVLLWNDTPWALVELFSARRLGPNLRVYCQKQDTQ